MSSVLIAGAAGGVGRALAQRLAAAGARLALVSRQPERLADVPGQLRIAADFGSAEGAETAFAAAASEFGAPVDGYAHCIGSSLIAPLSRTRLAQWRECFAVNVETAFLGCQAYLAQLNQTKRPGSIVLFSSVVAGMGVSNHAAIASAKAAIEGLTRALAADHSGSGIRINCIAPGLLRTPMTERMVANEAAGKQIAAQYPLGRFGSAEDGAAAAAWLLGPESAWMTGQVLHLDGGFSAVRPYVRA